MTFKFTARHCGADIPIVYFGIDVDDRVEFLFLPKEWEAFRSLLMPSAKADFTLEEFDEKGVRING